MHALKPQIMFSIQFNTFLKCQISSIILICFGIIYIRVYPLGGIIFINQYL